MGTGGRAGGRTGRLQGARFLFGYCKQRWPSTGSCLRLGVLVDGRRVTVQARPGGRFEVNANPGDQVRIPAGAVRDGFGNRTGQDFVFQA